MVAFILAIASLIILIPIMFLLPIGYSIKEKLGLIGIAFLFANVGLMANTQFQLFQSVLIIILLIILTTFILEKKFAKSLSSQSNIRLKEKKPNIQEHENLYMEKVDSKPQLELESITSANDLNATEQIENPLEEDHILKNVDDESEKQKDIQILEDNFKKFETELSHYEKKDDLLDMEEDISFLTNRAIKFDNHDSIDVKFEYDENEFATVNMSEIEKLIETNDIDFKENLELVQHRIDVEMEEIEEIELTRASNTEQKENRESISNDEIEIEELVFHK
ncbi:hypothetical protein [Cytobacillus dafuensis]|uniref:Uncharacterized protein n=1 Tax=Cytobacillus dafuensis TaxID=1742359 RepID=A0A5B8Z952_CYTDA|nr:hypothetical protein [Cytobacillus dafuensis]QED48803.1 hypothetical protein FSZ17_16940 [Cytobacillus dafuensis]